ncbi:MAG: hypothetical protein K940chlam6_00403 [Chlamydiae bacterium]|nr:hypothetical protein [Chlamydiota bacterium]
MKSLKFVLAILGTCIGISLTAIAAISTLSRNFAGIAAGSFITIQEVGGNIGVAVAITVVRLYATFIDGYHAGVWVLVGLCAIGLILTFLMPKRSKQKGPRKKAA